MHWDPQDYYCEASCSSSPYRPTRIPHLAVATVEKQGYQTFIVICENEPSENLKDDCLKWIEEQKGNTYLYLFYNRGFGCPFVEDGRDYSHARNIRGMRWEWIFEAKKTVLDMGPFAFAYDKVESGGKTLCIRKHYEHTSDRVEIFYAEKVSELYTCMEKAFCAYGV